MKNPIPLPLVMVVWQDACSNSPWESLDEILRWARSKDEDWIVHEVGWLLEQTADYILLSPQIGKDGVVGNSMKIPRAFIRVVQILAPGKG